MPVEDALRPRGFRGEDGPGGHVVVPLDQRRACADPADQLIVERPDRVADGPVMGVDQERGAIDVLGPRMAGEMDLADCVHREGVEIILRGCAVVDGGDEDVVDVEQETAARPADDVAQEVDLGNRARLEDDISRGVFEEHRAREGLLDLVDMVADAQKRLLRIGQWQEVREEDLAMARPGEMLGEESRLVAIDQSLEAIEVVTIERSRRSDRQADPVQGEGIALADGAELGMRRAAFAHVVLSMNLEEPHPRLRREDLRDVVVLEAHACAGCEAYFGTVFVHGTPVWLLGIWAGCRRHERAPGSAVSS